MDLDRLWAVADRARAPGRLTTADVAFVRDSVPEELETFPKLRLPNKVRHPGGFTIAGAPVGTFVRSALLIAGQKALGKRYDGSPFYERVEQDLAFRIMRSHFHNGYPKGAFCCIQCTMAVYPVLEAGAIRYFDCAELLANVRKIIRGRQWRFDRPINPALARWALPPELRARG
jgi:hypothetical protein